MSDLKRFCVEIPHFERRYLNGDYYRLRPDDYDKLKSQIEAVNALLDSAEPITKMIDGKYGLERIAKGYFIPMPEEPDSLEKLARDIVALSEHYYAPKSDIGKIVERAKRLTTKEGQ